MNHAVLVLILHQGEVLIGQGRDGLFTFPNGRLHPLEDLDEAARRIVRELTGLTPILGSKPLGHIVSHQTGQPTRLTTVYRTDSYMGNLDQSEAFAGMWTPVSELDSYFSQMRGGYRYWVPTALRGESFSVEVWYDAEWRVEKIDLKTPARGG